MADRGQNQQNANTRSSLQQHVADQNAHAATTSNYGGHGQAANDHPTGSPVPAGAGPAAGQAPPARAAAPTPPAPAAAAPAPPAPPQKLPMGGTAKTIPTAKPAAPATNQPPVNQGPATPFRGDGR